MYFYIMAAGMVNISNGGGTSSCEYIMRDGECEIYFSNIAETKAEILKQVSAWVKMEKRGNKELGIRGRHDARALKKLIITLPNKNTTAENKELLSLLLSKTEISDYPYMAAIHKGLKDGIENKHAHVNFFERKFEKGNSNKNRKFNLRTFANDFRADYQKIFKLEPGEKTRERLGRIQFVKRRQDENSLAEVEKEISETIKIIKNVRFRGELASGSPDSAAAEINKINLGATTDSIKSREGGVTRISDEQSKIDRNQSSDSLRGLAETIRNDERAAGASKAPAGKQNAPANKQRTPKQDRSADPGISK